MGMYVPEISPYYSPGSCLGQEHLRRLLETCVDFETIPELLAEDDDHPGLFISAVEVLTNEFELFREDDMSADAIPRLGRRTERVQRRRDRRPLLLGRSLRQEPADSGLQRGRGRPTPTRCG